MKVPKNQYFQNYISETIRKRLEEFGLSQYRFLQDNKNTTNEVTLRNILKGNYSTNIHTIAHYCDLLGLEIVIRPKESRK